MRLNALVSIRTVLAFAFCTIASMSIGCSTMQPPSKAAVTVKSMNEVYDSLGESTLQVNRTVELLNEIGRTGYLPDTFGKFKAAVSDLQASANEAAERGKTMRDHRDEYLAKWQWEAENASDPQVKATVQQRREVVAANFDQIAQATDDVRAAYRPFIDKLNAIQGSLNADLTPAAAKALQPNIASARKDGESLVQKLDTLGRQIDKARGKVVPVR